MGMEAGRADETTEECILDVENITLYNPSAEADEELMWAAHCIYRVPAHIRNLDARAYKPQLVSLGPFHHGDPDLMPMEGHKQRALQHVVQHAGGRVGEFVAALEEVAEELESAYMDLGDYWRGPGKRERRRFLQVMLTDGCFLLEVMRTADREHFEEYAYADSDPVFGRHGQRYTVPYILNDMHKIENQLPLLVLETILAVETEISPVNDGQKKDESINMMVRKFMSSSWGMSTMADDLGLGLHPLDISRRSRLVESYIETPPSLFGVTGGSSHTSDDSVVSSPSPSFEDELGWSQCDDNDVSAPPSAVELYEAGIGFGKSETLVLHDIGFDSKSGLLRMPFLAVNDFTEHMLLNMMAFERLHVTATYGVTRYVLFMEEMLKSAKDVALLRSKKLIGNDVGPDEEVARMFNRLTNGVMYDSEGPFNQVHRQMGEYLGRNYGRIFKKWLRHFIHTYFQNPWTAISLLAATVLLALAVVQTVCAVLALDNGDKDLPGHV